MGEAPRITTSHSLLAPLIQDDLRVSDQLRWHHLVGGNHFLSLIGNDFECVPSNPARIWMESGNCPGIDAHVEAVN